jgi:hypothetical protein
MGLLLSGLAAAAATGAGESSLETNGTAASGVESLAI